MGGPPGVFFLAIRTSSQLCGASPASASFRNSPQPQLISLLAPFPDADRSRIVFSVSVSSTFHRMRSIVKGIFCSIRRCLSSVAVVKTFVERNEQLSRTSRLMRLSEIRRLDRPSADLRLVFSNPLVVRQTQPQIHVTALRHEKTGKRGVWPFFITALK